MLKTKFSIVKKAKFVLVLLAFIAFLGTASSQDCDGFVNPNLDNLVGGCPTGISNVAAFVGWQQVTNATSDGFCSCSDGVFYMDDFGTCPNSLSHFLGGFGANPYPWIEYVGQCLTTPWVAGNKYKVSFDFVQTRGSGSHTINILGYRGTTCPSVPVNTGGDHLCGRPGWEVLASIVETSSGPNDVVTLSAEFTLTHDIAYVAFGECKTGNWANSDYKFWPYFVYDNFCVASKPSCAGASVILSNLDDEGCPNDVLSELIIYNGNAVMPAGTSLTFYDGDPSVAGATKLSTYVTTTDIAANATEKLKDVSIGTCAFNSDFIYVVLGDDGSNTIPLDLSNPLANPTYDDCDYTDNISVLKLKKPCAYFESVKKKK